MFAPLLDHAPSLEQIPEPMLVQTTVSELAVEALDKRILCRLTGLNEMQFHTSTPRPEKHRLTGQFRSVVADNRLGQAELFGQLIQIAGQALAGDRKVDQLTDAFA